MPVAFLLRATNEIRSDVRRSHTVALFSTAAAAVFTGMSRRVCNPNGHSFISLQSTVLFLSGSMTSIRYWPITRKQVTLAYAHKRPSNLLISCLVVFIWTLIYQSQNCSPQPSAGVVFCVCQHRPLERFLYEGLMEDARDLVSKVGRFQGREPPFAQDLLALALLLCCYLFMVASQWLSPAFIYRKHSKPRAGIKTSTILLVLCVRAFTFATQNKKLCFGELKKNWKNGFPLAIGCYGQLASVAISVRPPLFCCAKLLCLAVLFTLHQAEH